MKHTAIRLRSEEFDFPLPRERVALHPKPFEEQTLLVYDRTPRWLLTVLPSFGTVLVTFVVIGSSKAVPGYW